MCASNISPFKRYHFHFKWIHCQLNKNFPIKIFLFHKIICYLFWKRTTDITNSHFSCCCLQETPQKKKTRIPIQIIINWGVFFGWLRRLQIQLNIFSFGGSTNWAPYIQHLSLFMINASLSKLWMLSFFFNAFGGSGLVASTSKLQYILSYCRLL